MATDGVKIIDGDHAHDIYHTFMDLYDARVSFQAIQAIVEPLNIGDDFDQEIFITAYALALWETGQLTEAIRQQVWQAIQRGAFVAYLTEDEGLPAEGRRRQKVLDRFWQKINIPNPKIRKRKTHKLPSNFLFEEGDVLTFQLSDGSYRATIVLLISQARGRCIYFFMHSTFASLQKPIMEDILNGEVEGMIMPFGAPYEIGFTVTGIGHKHLRAAVTQFDRIGAIRISSDRKTIGPQGGAVDFASFASYFQHFDNFGVKKTAATHPKEIFPAHLLYS